MIESEEHGHSIAEQKAKIRERYRGIDTSELDVIPATPQENFYEDTREKRVAVYARVSTDDPRQTSSYELQKNHYLDVVSRHEGWKLVDIYADEWISGTSLQHRDSFIRMIRDCNDGKIDLIVTKSVSRFARNVLDCIGYVRKLAAMNPPIGVFFETENIFTLNSNSEMSLSFISTLAQEESHNKSEIMNASVEMRFRRGIFLTPPLLGYDLDDEGQLIVNQEEAKTVQLIFFMYLYGYSCQQIAETLTKLGRQTKRGNTAWSSGSIKQILQNERHCGDVLARKTFTPSYLDHKSKKNRQDRNQYRKKNHHDPIISRDDFIAVQRMLSNAKYGSKGFLPELHVIASGPLRGFVSINPRWAGFSEEDYKLASSSIYDEVVQLPSKPIEITAEAGSFDLRGFEVARAQFFSRSFRISMTVSLNTLSFSKLGIAKLNATPYVELLIHPSKRLLAIRPSSKDVRHSVNWTHNGLPRLISGAAFLPTLYHLLGWNEQFKYRVQGVRKKENDGVILLFDMSDTEILIPHESIVADSDTSQEKNSELTGLASSQRARRIVAFPAAWADGFGTKYYGHVHIEPFTPEEAKDGSFTEKGQPFTNGEELDVTPPDVAGQTIKRIIDEIKQENAL